MNRRPRVPPRLQVSVTAERPTRLAAGLATFLGTAAPRLAAGTVEVALVSDRHIRKLNRKFRGIDRSTDVLSFPAEEDPAVPVTGRLQPGARRKPMRDRHLGEIAIAVGVAKRQALERRHSVSTEVRVLALHGLLHLLGYDHERDRGEMRRVEARLCRRVGLLEGLIARARS